MAKLGVYYGLCPLIDQRSLLGVTEDESSGYAVVTLGKNIAIKYKLIDQKQVHSWSTKDRFTSPVIFDKKAQQYVAVFNHVAIRLFGSDCENLDRIKKYKFQAQIFTLLISDEGETFILFNNGTVSSLSHALDKRKLAPRESILAPGDVIEKHTCLILQDRTVVGLLVRCEDNTRKYLATSLTSDKATEDRQFIVLEKLVRTDCFLVGHLLIIVDNGLELLTLWSDGKLYSWLVSPNSKFPGKMLSVIEVLSCENQVSMASLSPTYIAMYGVDKNQEGACLIIYNIQFQVTQSKISFKLYTEGSELHIINENILMAIGNNLAVIPYNLATEQLATLVGSHKVARYLTSPDVEIVNDIEIANWETENGVEVPEVAIDIAESVRTNISAMIKEGYAEPLICENIIPQLVDKQDLDGIRSVLNYFSHIPEKLIVDIINFTIKAKDTVFKNSNLLEIEENTLQPIERCEFFNRIINLSFNDVIILPYLRANLDFSETLTFLEYMCILLGDNDWSLNEVDGIKSELKIIEWGSLLLDAHYQQFLLSRDPKVINILKRFQNLINMQISCVNEYKQILPTLDLITNRKNFCSSKQATSKWYSIEQINLY